MIGWRAYFRGSPPAPPRIPSGWIEHCSRRYIPVAFFRTALVSCTGYPLWRRLRMEHPIRPLRLTLVVLLLIGLTSAVVPEDLTRNARPLRFTFLVCATTAATFFCLPFVRRRVKAHRAHFLRCTVYLMLGAWPFTTLLTTIIEYETTRPLRSLAAPAWWRGVRDPTGFLTGGLNDLLILGPIAAILFLWWYQAAKHYLHMERPAVVAGSVTALGILTGCVLELFL